MQIVASTVHCWRMQSSLPYFTFRLENWILATTASTELQISPRVECLQRSNIYIFHHAFACKSLPHIQIPSSYVLLDSRYLLALDRKVVH